MGRVNSGGAGARWLGLWVLVAMWGPAVAAPASSPSGVTWVKKSVDAISSKERQSAAVPAPATVPPAPAVQDRAGSREQMWDALRSGTQALSPETHELGRKVYNFRCYFCHGYSGDAKTLAASYLQPKPRNFQTSSLSDMPRERVLQAIRHGVDATAMKGFREVISEAEIQAVGDFVRHEFMEKGAPNTRYHTVENGWPQHERYAVAFPFATGEIAIDQSLDSLSEEQKGGRRLFMQACISCHDHGRVEQPGKVWQSKAVTYPRDAYCLSCHEETPGGVPSKSSHPADASAEVYRGGLAASTYGRAGAPLSGSARQATHTFAGPGGRVPVSAAVPASPGETALANNYLVHDVRPNLDKPTPLQSQGEKLYHANCAFCHAADGTGKGWIGSFLDPSPRNLTDPAGMAGMSRARVKQAISEGMAQSSMPAWKHVLTPDQIDAITAYVDRVFHPLKP